MVKKLIKYDFTSYLRLLLPVQIILLGIAAVNRIVQIFEDSSNAVYNIIFTSSMVLYGVSVLVCLLMAVIVAIVRFYQGMYTNEGYLNHTLPVTSAQHIISKLITSVMFILGSILAVIISFFIVTLGDANIEIMKAAGYLMGEFFTYFGRSAPLYILEFILLILAAIVAGMLCFYFCISIGQLASKKKVLLAFGAYFGLYIVGQIFGTIVVIIVSTMDFNTLLRIADWIAHNLTEFYHLVFIGSIAYELVLGAVFFFVSRHIMSKKLNLS